MSLTLSSLGVLVLASLFNWADIDIAQGDVEQGVTFLVQLFSLVGIYWGRVRKGDVNWLGLRKLPPGITG